MSQAVAELLAPTTSTSRLLSAANTVNATIVKASKGILRSINGFNAGAITYLKIYDKATAPDENDTPRQTLYIAANTMFNFQFDNGLELSAGIGYRMTTAGADNSTAAVAAAAILAMNVNYT